MLELATGNLLECEADALINTVNCVGVMGKGIALQFKQAFPENTKAYERACRAKELHPGKVLVVATGQMTPRFVINFPTKQHWKGKSRIAFIRAGLKALVEEIVSRGIKSVAIPPLGCGNGGLDWSEVYPLIEAAFANQPEVRVVVFSPSSAPGPQAMPVATARPSLTRARALLIKLIERYCQPGYKLGKLEIQKLAYFLQEADEPLNLNFVKHTFGPYAENLNFVLQKVEGHWVRGYGDRSGAAQLQLLPGAAEEADRFLKDDHDAAARLEAVSQLIAGFETPHAIELLATVHWVVKREMPLTSDVDVAIQKVHAWNARKKKAFTPDHIRIAWRRITHTREASGNNGSHGGRPPVV
jgi:O-acetyl-ADP-ribose deacetylase (regulator of RNase III)